jgi:hypothetical protein
MAEQIPRTNPQLCSAEYSAEQVPGYVILTATGLHQTSGYRVLFQQSPLDIFPPQFSLWHVFSGGIVLDVVTPFAEHVQFAAKERLSEVVVWDSSGKHVVQVSSAPDLQLRHAAEFLEKDGPFPKST